MPDLQTQLARNGAERFTMTGAEFDVFIHGAVAKWRKVVEFAGIQN